MIDPDEIDFGAYMRQTEPAMKVREASVFAEELAAEFVPRTYTRSTAAMHSTKLGRSGCR